ncbi:MULTISPECIES: MAE_28990/MAE_18760 family HEPN-like nuclease [Pseudanabaena]|uniref:MAE_28990/MAE_18760 family HEPN-like nuclease n=1 Tax=Pseudanabaena TaxID=1152 RepID=UPI0024784545|nr:MULTISPECIES: MAE_28990/MAE_18760 family HEPN-like nuclease [Pseudanabaena]MEA5487759.1 MAE_28990/MAE_18760 family HEPN-like nuclease [Pseudanabaena sp. CCNP1317]WGS72503.1 MAE_28990/MAE_18760 family HEPN-like nuclease [Pseudanabaena galeata CCNP1313]
MDDFDVAVQEAIEERLTVLFEIERAIFTKRYSLSIKHQEIFATQSISMIYAIWEGFVQTAFNLYIDELNKIDIEFYDFSDDIVIHHMESSFKQFREYPNKDKQKIRFFRDIKTFHNERSQPISRVVNTQSNVSFSVLNKLLKTFSLEQFPEHWKDYKHPNPNLKSSMDSFLRLRNTVAHGGDLVSEGKVNQSVYMRFRNLVVDLMYEIRVKMLDGLERKTFLQ